MTSPVHKIPICILVKMLCGACLGALGYCIMKREPMTACKSCEEKIQKYHKDQRLKII